MRMNLDQQEKALVDRAAAAIAKWAMLAENDPADPSKKDDVAYRKEEAFRRYAKDPEGVEEELERVDPGLRQSAQDFKAAEEYVDQNVVPVASIKVDNVVRSLPMIPRVEAVLRAAVERAKRGDNPEAAIQREVVSTAIALHRELGTDPGAIFAGCKNDADEQAIFDAVLRGPDPVAPTHDTPEAADAALRQMATDDGSFQELSGGVLFQPEFSTADIQAMQDEIDRANKPLPEDDRPPLRRWDGRRGVYVD